MQGTTQSGVVSGSSALIGGQTVTQSTQYLPYQQGYTQAIPWTGGGLTSPVDKTDINLRKVENGWILKMHNKEYVLTETEQVTKYLKLFEESK